MSLFKKILVCISVLLLSPLSANYSLSQIHAPGESTHTREVVHIEDEEMELPETLTSSEPSEYNYWQQFFKMMFILGVILGVVLIIAWVLKGFLNKRIKQVNSQNQIKVLERRNLSQKSMLFLVEVDGKKMVVGDSQNGGLRLLMNLDEEEIPESEASKTQDIASKFSFSQILQRKLRRSSSPLSQNIQSDYEIYEEN